MKKIIISESERNQIISKHHIVPQIDVNNVVISDWLSPDEKYVIFLDELYDLENKTKLGDIWKSTDNLLLFLEHTFKVSNLRQDIKEQACKIFNKVLLNENKNDLTYLKPTIKQFLLSESFLDDVWNTGAKVLGYTGKFIKDTAKSTVKGVSDFGKDLVKGGAILGNAVLSGEWKEVLNLMKQGIKWLARKIRQAIYSPVGIIIDTILVVTGVGKIPQVAVWAIIVSLDIYEFVTGDYEHKNEHIIFRILFFLIDILGLVTSGAAAFAARTMLKATGGTVRGVENLAVKNQSFRDMLVSLFKSLKKLPSKLTEIGSMLAKGKFGKLINIALQNVNRFINFILEQIKSVFKSPALKPVLINSGIILAIGTGVEAYKDHKKNKEETQHKIDMKVAKEKETKDIDDLEGQLMTKPTDMSSVL